jgi:hypothetical protein
LIDSQIQAVTPLPHCLAAPTAKFFAGVTYEHKKLTEHVSVFFKQDPFELILLGNLIVQGNWDCRHAYAKVKLLKLFKHAHIYIFIDINMYAYTHII